MSVGSRARAVRSSVTPSLATSRQGAQWAARMSRARVASTSSARAGTASAPQRNARARNPKPKNVSRLFFRVSIEKWQYMGVEQLRLLIVQHVRDSGHDDEVRAWDCSVDGLRGCDRRRGVDLPDDDACGQADGAKSIGNV